MFLRWPASPHFLALRGLAWRDDVLYASHGYSLLRARVNPKPNPNLAGIEWQRVARYSLALVVKFECALAAYFPPLPRRLSCFSGRHLSTG